MSLTLAAPAEHEPVVKKSRFLGRVEPCADRATALARVAGVQLDAADIAATMAFVGTFPPEATTSFQRDLLAGRRSEYAALTGAVPRLAERYGFTPMVFDQLDAMIHARLHVV